MFHADGRTDGKDGQTDMTKLLVVFRNFATAPKNPSVLGSSLERTSPSFVEGLM